MSDYSADYKTEQIPLQFVPVDDAARGDAGDPAHDRPGAG